MWKQIFFNVKKTYLRVYFKCSAQRSYAISSLKKEFLCTKPHKWPSLGFKILPPYYVYSYLMVLTFVPWQITSICKCSVTWSASLKILPNILKCNIQLNCFSFKIPLQMKQCYQTTFKFMFQIYEFFFLLHLVNTGI